MLRNIPLYFQRLTFDPGDSARHTRDMKRLDSSAQKASQDPSVARLVALDRDMRTGMLGIRDLYKPGHHPAHRPKTVDAALKRDEIAQWIAFMRAVHPEWSQKEIYSRITAHYGVRRSYIFQVLKEVDPQRWRDMQDSAAAMVECGMMTPAT
jgi:hypothetical protein